MFSDGLEFQPQYQTSSGSAIGIERLTKKCQSDYKFFFFWGVVVVFFFVVFFVVRFVVQVVVVFVFFFTCRRLDTTGLVIWRKKNKKICSSR